MEFLYSPVPLFVGLWGDEDKYILAKKEVKKMIKEMKKEKEKELETEIGVVMFDLEEHSFEGV